MPVSRKQGPTQRASRTREAAGRSIREEALSGIADTLDKVRNDERCSKYLRERAGEVMRYLK
jgi:propanediol dehydratase small subunit